MYYLYENNETSETRNNKFSYKQNGNIFCDHFFDIWQVETKYENCIILYMIYDVHLKCFLKLYRYSLFSYNCLLCKHWVLSIT